MDYDYYRYANAKDKIFKLAKYLKELFEQARKVDDEKLKLKYIEKIKLYQKKGYRYIERKHLADNKGGTYKCYPGGIVDVVKPNTHKQNVLDILDYFFC